ncbi:short-chain dehydrogenase [Exidia glandulosa HHB12029]|uniref:Short-chain dehydrogenase n=1 Tax=Exidia glandulosa HHB12029 TaxID=1314781 RepID=A0A165E4T6_EXIGL|nr:short-chain dehydrogenase [Exidia glandulosa HHB12029]
MDPVAAGNYGHLRAENLYNVTGRVALVTGGGTGIGLMIAQGLAINGARVYIAGRRKDVLEKAISDLAKGTGELIPLVLDVTDKASITNAVNEIEAREGRLHILVNNAGQTGPVSHFFSEPSSEPSKLGPALFENETFEQWAQLFTVNVSSAFFVTTAFLALLDKGSDDGVSSGYSSVVINISSISGLMKLSQNHFAYNTSKAALIHLGKMMATEFALKSVRVRVNDIAPGVYASEMTNREGGRFTPEESTKISGSLRPLPAGRDGSDAEMAATALYLASPAGAYMNGQTLTIDGSFVAVNPAVA